MTISIAVVNTGASSLKLALVEYSEHRVRETHRVQLDWQPSKDSAQVLRQAFESLGEVPDAFGHRFVHGGIDFIDPVTITTETVAALEAKLALAPLHNGVALNAIREVRAIYSDVPCVAVFDTAFHANRAPVSMRYALPVELVRSHQLRRYGFHGLAHASLLESLVEASGTCTDEVSAVTLQLGAGCSACAVQRGRSIETSMGFTPLEGLVMATRSGNVDPTIPIHLMRAGFSADRIENELTNRSGLRALSGLSDMREILAAEARGQQTAKAAIDLFCYHVILTVGAYFTLLGGKGPLVFGGGIGTNSPQIRERIARGLSAWNIVLDAERNASGRVGSISAEGSRQVYVFNTNEEAVIAREVANHLGQQ